MAYIKETGKNPTILFAMILDLMARPICMAYLLKPVCSNDPRLCFSCDSHRVYNSVIIRSVQFSFNPTSALELYTAQLCGIMVCLLDLYFVSVTLQ
ncbi:hypothetical protein TNCV_3962131 [Trichonephila clavipes]|nr:hypothetical protein TNCV_3962131 [Trichonephila clavipes]